MTSSLREWRRASQHYFHWKVQSLRGGSPRGDILVKTQWKANIESSHRMARCCCEGERNLETYSRNTSVESSCRMARSEWIGKMTYDRHAPNLIPRQSGHLQLSLLEADGKRSGLTRWQNKNLLLLVIKSRDWIKRQLQLSKKQNKIYIFQLQICHLKTYQGAE